MSKAFKGNKIILLDFGKFPREATQQVEMILNSISRKIKLYKSLEKEGFKARSNEKTQRNKKILELYKSGKTMQQIGNKFNISKQSVCNILKRYKITKL